MKAGKYSIKEMFVNRHVQQIIIPEIQRDYVWGEEQVDGLLNSIKKDFDVYFSREKIIPEIQTTDNNLKKAFKEFYQKRNNSSNIGFIYAYNDSQYSGKYFLIDGQQRITTIYITLLALASLDNDLKERFKATYLFEDRLKLDYKVRESSHQFLNEFVKNVLKGKENLKDESWYYKNQYNTDKTVQSLLSNLDVIKHFFLKQQRFDLVEFYNYLENYVDFWYFDTNISEQGEELYLYMNARGEQMQGNENIKADLLGRIDSKENKNRYGKIWEDWQDYFWKNKGNNINADKGFNQFLACIAGLEYFLKGDKTKQYSKDKFDKNTEIRALDLIDSLSIETIEKYFNALTFLFDNKEQFKQTRNYCDWLDLALNDFWGLINDTTINWFANYEDNNRATERNAMVYVWSVLIFIVERKKTTLLLTETYRLFRIYYLRYKNYIRSVNNIKIEVNLQVSSGIWKEPIIEIEGKATQDERLKIKIFNTCNPSLKIEIEELIWQIEDHPFNLNGRDVGNTNLSHLIDNNKEITIDYLTGVRDKFNELFPENNSNSNKVKHLLLYYGNYFDRVSPHYYMNFKFNNWRRIVRGLSTELEENENPFYNLFNDFIGFNGSLEEFIIKKDSENLQKENCTLFKDKVLWYSRNVGDKIWNEGNNIAHSLGNPCSFPDWKNKDREFLTDFKFYNTKGNLQGGKPKELSKLLKNKNAQ